ncbi:SOS response-associated peptidase [Herbaspirillum lusitanum]|uniref:SOS response-associated peptidase n=1 Tax=Herbaspirillum lusitanum TaxID=213312 RepID=UPI0038991DBD
MAGRFVRVSTRLDAIQELGAAYEHAKWVGGDLIPQYSVATGMFLLTLHVLNGKLGSDTLPFGYRSPDGMARGESRSPTIPLEMAATGRFVRHMFESGRVLVPMDGWYEWSDEKTRRQPWYIRLKTDKPMFAAALTNFKPNQQQQVEVGVGILTTDADAGLSDIHPRRPVILAPDAALKWLDISATTQEIFTLARHGLRPASDFDWYKVSDAINHAKHPSETTIEEGRAFIAPAATRPT